MEADRCSSGSGYRVRVMPCCLKGSWVVGMSCVPAAGRLQHAGLLAWVANPVVCPSQVVVIKASCLTAAGVTCLDRPLPPCLTRLPPDCCTHPCGFATRALPCACCRQHTCCIGYVCGACSTGVLHLFASCLPPPQLHCVSCQSASLCSAVLCAHTMKGCTRRVAGLAAATRQGACHGFRVHGLGVSQVLSAGSALPASEGGVGRLQWSARRGLG
jgi:hypothetical protein